MGKKVAFQPKPVRVEPAKPADPDAADRWVAGTTPPEPTLEKLKTPKKKKIATTRYTIDIPTELHAQIKIKCFREKLKMNEEIVKLLEERFGKD